MGWEQWVVAFNYFASFGIVMAKYGQKRTDSFDWTDLVASALMMALLWSGGFFSG
jgi:hypothetical protein